MTTSMQVLSHPPVGTSATQRIHYLFLLVEFLIYLFPPLACVYIAAVGARRNGLAAHARGVVLCLVGGAGCRFEQLHERNNYRSHFCSPSPSSALLRFFLAHRYTTYLVRMYDQKKHYSNTRKEKKKRNFALYTVEKPPHSVPRHVDSLTSFRVI